MQYLIGALIGFTAWLLLRFLLMGLYTVDQNERAVKTSFGRAVRVAGGKTTLDDPIAEFLLSRGTSAVQLTRRSAWFHPADPTSKCPGRRFARSPSPP